MFQIIFEDLVSQTDVKSRLKSKCKKHCLVREKSINVASVNTLTDSFKTSFAARFRPIIQTLLYLIYPTV